MEVEAKETFLDDDTYDALIAAIREALRPDESAVKMLLAEIAGIFPARIKES